jgi:hypothetical protein
VWVHALVQQVSSGRVVTLRHEQEETALRSIRPDLMMAWMFREDYDGKSPAEVLYVIYNTGLKITNPGIEEVPSHILDYVRPKILVGRMAA